MSIELQKTISEKLEFFLKTEKIPNIIFHGPSGSGKRTVVHNFVSNIYGNDKDLIKAYVMNADCAHGKGIKFVRDELKFFAKTHINMKGTGHFKTIILSNADKLTIDAQSALRRCIELFSHTTRFFIIVQDKYKLLKPILSRFCEVFIPEPIVNNMKINLHKHVLNNCFNMESMESKRRTCLKRLLDKQNITDHSSLIALSCSLYEKGFSGLDIMDYTEKSNIIDKKKYQMLIAFHKVKREFRNEKLLIFFMLNFIFIRSDYDLENMSFM